MRTARDNAVWKMRVLLKGPSGWKPKTFFYSRAFHVDRWRDRADHLPERIQINFIGKYILEEHSDPQDDHHHDHPVQEGQ